MTKKLLCLLLALACVISLTACGGTDTTEPTGDTSAAIQATESGKQTDSTGSSAEPTTGSATQATAGETISDQTPTDSVGWDDDGVLKILTIGNSFSVDCMEYVYQIAQAAGVQKIKLGNLYISGCSLSKHLTNAKSDAKAYTFYTNENGKWVTNSNYKFSNGIKNDNWDFISFQQASGSSGKADTYDDVYELLSIVEGYCTNKNVEYMWHMTWAYQGNSTHSSFPDYNSDQMTMYNAIVNAVQTKINPTKFTRLVPNGTAV